VHEKRGERLKTCALQRQRMYRIPEKVPEFEKFDMVFEGKLNRQNRWVILADVKVGLNFPAGGADKILDINHDQEVVRVFTGRSNQGT